MPKLYHYKKTPFMLCPKGPEDFADSDDGAKPGGLWLSARDSSNNDSWFQLVISSTRTRPDEWCHYDIRYETEFDMASPVPAEILVLTCENEYLQFMQSYGEPDQSGVTSIRWCRVKQDYKGIAIDPYRRELSRKGSNQRQYNWNSFDCSSWCLWDVKFLLDEGYLTLVERNRQMQISEPNAFGFKCNCCTTYFRNNPHMQ